MQSVAVLRPHPIIWRDPPLWPFVWRGLLPLLALLLAAAFALGPFAHTAIQGSVQRELHEQLAAAGFGWVAIGVSGQDVTLSGDEPAAGAGERALALAQTARCPTWSGRRVCAAHVAAHFSAPVPLAGSALTPGAAQACDQAFAALLTAGQIEFASASATIDAASGPLLDRLAHEARACPGLIRIEGHTDLIGRGEFNRNLSEVRATAVRDALIARGVPAKRLRTQGFGARRPIADNATESGRARNRRIEFHAVGAD